MEELKIAKFMAKRYACWYGGDVEEAYSAALVGLAGALRYWKPERGDTYLFRAVKAALMRGSEFFVSGKGVQLRDKLEMQDWLIWEDSPEDKVINKMVLDDVASIAKPHIRAMFCLLRRGYNTEEIGRKLGCSRANVSNCIKYTIRRYNRGVHIHRGR